MSESCVSQKHQFISLRFPPSSIRSQYKLGPNQYTDRTNGYVFGRKQNSMNFYVRRNVCGSIHVRFERNLPGDHTSLWACLVANGTSRSGMLEISDPFPVLTCLCTCNVKVSVTTCASQ